MKSHSCRLFIWFLLTLAFSISNAPAQAQQGVVQDDIEDALQLVPCKQEDRLAAVKKLFIQMGAPESDISTEKLGKAENLIVKMKGKTDQTIIVGAHYDKVEMGCGAIDNWTGIVILAHLYKTLLQYSLDKSYQFVAFDKEEDGLIGSKAMVKAIPKENYSKYCAMVNLDSFGFAPPQAADNMSDQRLVYLARKVAARSKIPFSDASILGADADSSSFMAKKIPAITFHGMARNWQLYLHTQNDKLSNINARSVYIGYRFVFDYLTELETRGCGSFE